MSRLTLVLLAVLALVPPPASGPLWTPLQTGVSTRLRGVSTAAAHVVWASGASGTILRSADSGRSWAKLSIPGTENLDFRDVDAVDERTAYLLSIGPGEQSRIFKTADAGASWIEQFVNRDEKAFFDAMAFWDAARGLAFSDSVDGRFLVLGTVDGGRTWARLPPERLPRALENEGAFAASGTNIAVHPPGHAWIGTGAASTARVLRTADGGATWSIADTPLAAGPTSGIFSIAFRDPSHGIVVGGDYRREAEALNNAAVTADGGGTWAPVRGLSGFRSAVAFHPRRHATVVAVGPAGADCSLDGGRTWKPITGGGYHAFAFLADGTGIGVGENGRAGLLSGW